MKRIKVLYDPDRNMVSINLGKDIDYMTYITKEGETEISLFESFDRPVVEDAKLIFTMEEAKTYLDKEVPDGH